MKNTLFMFISMSLLTSCNLKEKATDAVTKTMEQAIEAKVGQDIDLPSAESMLENHASVTYTVGDKTYLTPEEKMHAVVLVNKDASGLSISFQLSSESGSTMVVTASHVQQIKPLPLKAAFNAGNSYDGVHPLATAIFMSVQDNTISSNAIPYDGELIITRLSEEEVAFEVQAKGGHPQEATTPQSWKPIVIKASLKKPIIQTMGVESETIFQ